MRDMIYIGGKSIDLEFLQETPSTANSSTYTFAGQNIGDADTSRRVVVCIAGRRDAGGNVNSVTIGGVAATVHMNNSIGNGSIATASAIVPTGTVADVVVNWSILQAACSIILYSVKGAEDLTPYVTLVDTSNPLNITPVLTEESAVIAHAKLFSTGSFSWSGTLGLSEDIDHAVESTTHSSASGLVEGTGTVIATPSNTSSLGMHIIGFK